MFVDKVEINVRGGKGGDGAVSFRREKYIPFGGPDGGDGGDGGCVFIKANPDLTTLEFLRKKHFIIAPSGGRGGGKKKHGRKGKDVFLNVPLGTIVYKLVGQDKMVIADIKEIEQMLEVVKGGKGGRGNARLASSTQQAPEIAKPGNLGEEKLLILELKIIADVGIIGNPNVGKSTLLNTATSAHPKIASYPFTTTEPVLGVVNVGWSSFVLAEIPGLIPGAHLGKGLGHEFLRHVERTRLLLHLMDGSSNNIIEDWKKINEELRLYQPMLTSKPQVVAVNKIDLPQVRERLYLLEKELNEVVSKAFFISAVTGEGIGELMRHLADLLASLEKQKEAETEKVFHPRPVDVGKGEYK